jgi:hypothetical protein
MTDFNFREFVLNENKVYLAKEIGDVLNSAQELSDEVNKIGTRNLTRYSQIIVNKSRGILQGHWGNENRKFLKTLQKCAVALAKSIDENDNIEEVLKSTIEALQKVVGKMGVPINAFQITQKPAEIETPKDVATQDIAPEAPPVSGFDTSAAAPISQYPQK